MSQILSRTNTYVLRGYDESSEAAVSVGAFMNLLVEFKLQRIVFSR